MRLVLLKKAAQLRDDLRIVYIDMGAILAQQKHYPEAIAALQRLRNWILRNLTPIFAWDACTKPRETLRLRTRSLPSFASYIKKRMTILPLKCPLRRPQHPSRTRL